MRWLTGKGRVGASGCAPRRGPADFPLPLRAVGSHRALGSPPQLLLASCARPRGQQREGPRSSRGCSRPAPTARFSLGLFSAPQALTAPQTGRNGAAVGPGLLPACCPRGREVSLRPLWAAWGRICAEQRGLRACRALPRALFGVSLGFLHRALSKPRPLPCGELENNNKIGGV